MKRRDFLRIATGAAVAAGCGVGGGEGDRPDGGALDDDPLVPVEPPEQTFRAPDGVFPLGLASGDVTDRRAVLWTQRPGDGPLRLRVYRMDGDRYAAVAVSADVVPDANGFAQVDVDGLMPATSYRYAFFDRAGRGFIGRFRTAPEDATRPLVVGAVSCTKMGYSFGTIVQASTREDLDLFIQAGDVSYNDGAATPEEYRAKWKTTLEAPGYQTLRARVPILAVWDDHDVTNNWDAQRTPRAQQDAGMQAFFDHLPVRRMPGAPGRLWRSVRHGAAEVFLLDCRSERQAWSDVRFISREQMEWLKAALLRSTAAFKIIVSSQPIGDMPVEFSLVDATRWTGYPTERMEILRHIDDRGITGVIWLGGEFHFPLAGRVAATGPGSSQLQLLVGPGAQQINPLWPVVRGPAYDWIGITPNYAVLVLDPAARTVRVRYHDVGDAILWEKTYLV